MKQVNSVFFGLLSDLRDSDSYFYKKFFNGPIIVTDRASEKSNFSVPKC